MSGYTPGPWHWVNFPDGRKLLMAADRAVIFLDCADAPITCHPADQKVIGAVPDLAESLVEFVALYDGVRDLLDATVRHKLARAEAALTKAGIELPTRKD